MDKICFETFWIKNFPNNLRLFKEKFFIFKVTLNMKMMKMIKVTKMVKYEDAEDDKSNENG